MSVRGVATATGATITATGQFLAGDGAAGAPSYAFTSAPSTGFYLGAGVMRFQVGGGAVVVIGATQFFPGANGTIDLGFANIGWKRIYLDYTNTGTVGAVTINKSAGRVNLGAGQTALVLTNSNITAASKVMLQMASAPGNAVAVSFVAVSGVGTCTITATPAVTNQTAIDFLVVNAD